MLARTFFLFGALVGVVGTASCQTPPPPPPPLPQRQAPAVRVTVKASPTGQPPRNPQFQSIISRLDPQKLQRLIPGSWEAQVLAATTKVVADTLRLDIPEPDSVGFTTFSSADGDVLLARWNGAPGRPEKAVWLWNEPWQDVFVFEVDPSLLERGALTRFSEDLFQWDAPPLHLRSLALTYLDSEPGRQYAFGSGEHVQTQRGTYGLLLMAAAQGGRAYIGVILTKAISGDGRLFGSFAVPERFPPLRERVTTWPRARLLAEIGKGFSLLRDLVYHYPDVRDGILLRELLSRGAVSREEVRQIAIGEYGDVDSLATEIVEKRVVAFLSAAETHKQLDAYLPLLVPMIAEARLNPGLAGPLVMARVAQTFERNGLDFCPTALTLVANPTYAQFALQYLWLNARDERILRQLELAQVPPGMEERKTTAVRSIRERLGTSPAVP